MLRVATLGPGGTNHELVTQRYLRALGIEEYSLTLVSAFADAVEALVEGRIDIIVQCAVHPETPQILGRNFRRIFAVDCFIGDSQELGIVSRRDVAQPRSLGILLPANRDYTDISRWPEHRNVSSLPLIGDLLLAGELDSGLTYTAIATEHPDTLRVDEIIGSPDDVWIVYARERALSAGGIITSLDGPGATTLRRIGGL